MDGLKRMNPTVPGVAAELRDVKKTEQRLARIEEIEDRVYDISTQVIEATLAFSEVTPDQAVPPPEWVELYGEKAAMQRLQVAKGGWMRQSDAPSAVKLAAIVRNGIIRGRNYNKQLVNQQINVKIALPAPTSQEHPGAEVYEVRDVD
jgi:hypothetical protein